MGSIEVWSSMAVMTIICGVWSLWHIFSTILAGGVGKNGSTVAVSCTSYINPTLIKIKRKYKTASLRGDFPILVPAH